MERLPEFIGNHPVLSLGMVAITVALIYNELSRFTQGFKSVTPAQLTHLINRQNALLVDVSPINDYEKGHIPGAKHVALSQLDAENPALSKVRALPVAICCRSGVSSVQAAKRLVKDGFEHVYNLEGGVSAWQRAELPLVSGKS